jgi:CBS domain-containing protein
MIVENLSSVTSNRLMTIAVHAPVATAARALLDQNIGLLIVCGPGGEVVGVLSRLDLVRYLAGNVRCGTLAELMSTNVVSCRPQDHLYDAWRSMVANRLQNLPVIDIQSRPVGVLDLRDALKALFEEEQYQQQLLENYVAGVGYH